MMRRLLIVVLIGAASAAICLARDGNGIPEDLTSKISGKTSVTYLDLVRKVFPDAEADLNSDYLWARTRIELRPLFGQELPEIYRADMEGRLLIGVREKMETVNGRDRVFWLLMGAFEESDGTPSNGGNRVLAAFRIGKDKAELIDAATVKIGDNTSLSRLDTTFKGPEKFNLATGRQAVGIYNSMQITTAQTNFSLVDIDKNRFRVLLNDFDIWLDNRCGRFVDESARINVLKTSTGGYKNIEIIVKTEIGSGDSDERGAGTDTVEWYRHYRYVFAWQPRDGSYKPVIDPGKRRSAALKRFNPCRYNA